MRVLIQRVAEASVTVDAQIVGQTGPGLLILACAMRSDDDPGFSSAAAPEDGRLLYERFAQALRDLGVATETGRFGADMQVALVNDGPVTIWMDSADRA